MSEARTYSAVIAHAADGMFGACARAKGVPNPSPDVEKRFTKKADLAKALADGIITVYLRAKNIVPPGSERR